MQIISSWDNLYERQSLFSMENKNLLQFSRLLI